MSSPTIVAVFLCVLAASVSACAQGNPAGDHPELAMTPPVVVPVAAPAAVHLTRLFGDARFERPLDAAQAPGDTRTTFVVEQAGTIFRLIPGIAGWVRQPFLNIRDRVTRNGNEEGLLGLAFDPHFAEEGHAHRGALYVDYSVKPGHLSRLSRFVLKPGESTVDPSSEQILMEIEQPYPNHNGGCLQFGPDGMLYYGLGDGGAANDPHGNGQKLDTLLAKILRIDVSPRDDGKPYGIPADNPFVSRPGARPEIWAYGMRNPWRFSFDRATGECWVGDVGQNLYEFVHVTKAGGNDGWSLVEGFHRFKLASGDKLPGDDVPPVFEYPHLAARDDDGIAAGRVVDVGDGLSITGGFVYRGARIPGLVGWYVFGDYVTKHVWAIRRTADGKVEHAQLIADAGLISSFAQMTDGELLVIDHQGYVCQLQPGAPAGPAHADGEAAEPTHAQGTPSQPAHAAGESHGETQHGDTHGEDKPAAPGSPPEDGATSGDGKSP
jgi:glucose/arabinose dehydrogenase